MHKKFYRMRLSEDENGVAVLTSTYVSIHETEYYHFCVDEFSTFVTDRLTIPEGTNKVSFIKNEKPHIRITKVAKHSSRIAFESPELALENLKYRTNRRVGHLSRDLSMCKRFLANADKISNLSDSHITYIHTYIY